MVFSPQQVKFEFLSYIKEFGGAAGEWRVGAGSDADVALFAENEVDRERDVWLWKPTLSPSAAAIVLRCFTEQFGVPASANSAKGPVVFLFKKTTKDREAAV